MISEKSIDHSGKTCYGTLSRFQQSPGHVKPPSWPKESKKPMTTKLSMSDSKLESLVAGEERSANENEAKLGPLVLFSSVPSFVMLTDLFIARLKSLIDVNI